MGFRRMSDTLYSWNQEDAKKEEKLITSKYSKLGRETELKNIYKGIFEGQLKASDKAMVNYLDKLVKNDLLMDFINFLNEAKGVQIIRKVGGDSPYNDPLDVGYTYANYVTFGYGGVVIEPENPKYYNVNDFIRAIERKYSFYLEKYREEKEKRNQDAARKAREEREREMAPRRQRYDKFMEAYKLWCSKDAYWHMANRKKLPIPEKFGVTEEDLEKFGYYSAAAKNQRLEDYRNASRKYEYGNSALKGLFTGGKRRPIPEDYGLESSEVDHLSVGQLLNEGRGR